MDVARSRENFVIVAGSMHFITMNRQTIISGHHGIRTVSCPACLHKISQLGGIDEINDNHELSGPKGTKKRTVTSIKKKPIE